MGKDVRQMLRAARSALRFARLLDQFEMKDAPGATTVFVTKKGKVIGTVRGQRFIGKAKREGK